MMRAHDVHDRLRLVPTALMRRLNDIAFCAWIDAAAPDDRLEYHRGFLGIDTQAAISTLPEPDRRQLVALASVAHRAFVAGLVHLVQARLGPDHFAYIAVARPRPKVAAVSLSALLLAALEQRDAPDPPDERVAA